VTLLLSRRRLLAATGASVLLAACGGGEESVPTGPGLRSAAIVRHVLYGAAGDIDLTEDEALGAAFLRECAIATPEVSFKWAALRPDPQSFDFKAADAIQAWTSSKAVALRGHALAWHQALPDWFEAYANRSNAGQLLDTHIDTVVGHYAGKLHSWDVVNEALDPFSDRDDGLRETPWLDFLGTGYIERAFRRAAAADASTSLVYNDYGFENDPGAAEKRAALLRLLEGLKTNGVPIKAAGIQAHLLQNNPDWSAFDATAYRAFLKEIAAMGLGIYVTELDVNDGGFAKDVSKRDEAVAGVYRDYLAVVLDEPALQVVETWGLSDRTSWIRNSYPRKDGALPRPLPLDDNFRRKPAWTAIEAAFSGKSTTG
jgi:endo-1,4-beta-xylanase